MSVRTLQSVLLSHKVSGGGKYLPRIASTLGVSAFGRSFELARSALAASTFGHVHVRHVVLAAQTRPISVGYSRRCYTSCDVGLVSHRFQVARPATCRSTAQVIKHQPYRDCLPEQFVDHPVDRPIPAIHRDQAVSRWGLTALPDPTP